MRTAIFLPGRIKKTLMNVYFMAGNLFEIYMKIDFF